MNHPLDRQVTLSGEVYMLRFSMGALAKMSSKLGANSPVKLAEHLRSFDKKNYKRTSLALLNSLILDGKFLDVSDQDLQDIIPLIADMIVEAFNV